MEFIGHLGIKLGSIAVFMISYELLKSVVSLFLEISDKPNHLIQTRVRIFDIKGF